MPWKCPSPFRLLSMPLYSIYHAFPHDVLLGSHKISKHPLPVGTRLCGFNTFETLILVHLCIICVVFTFCYSFMPSTNNGRPMLNVSLNMNLLTPEIARGEIKRFHVNVNTERLVGGAMGDFTPINVCSKLISTIVPVSLPVDYLLTLMK